MEANARYFNEQVTVVDNLGSLPLGNLDHSVEEHASKLPHLRIEEAGVFIQ